MSGDSSSLQPYDSHAVRERLQQFDGGLDAFEARIGFPGLVADSNSEAKNFLAMSREEMRKLSSSECGEGAIILRQFATHIQRVINRMQTRMKWVNAQIRLDATSKGKSKDAQPLYSANGRFELERLLSETQLRLERLAYLTNKIDAVADSFGSLQFSKRKRGENE